MNLDNFDERMTIEIDELLRELYSPSVSNGNLTNNKNYELLQSYRMIMDKMSDVKTSFLRQRYIVLIDRFLEVLGKNKELFLMYSNHINDYINRIGNASNDSINYFLSFKTFELMPIYWKIDDGKYEGNSNLKEQLDIFRKFINENSKIILFNMFQEYYKYQEFYSFTDYSECIKDTVIMLFLSGKKCPEFEFENLVMSISYAGVDGNKGYDFNGIKTIKNVFGLVSDLELIEMTLSRLANSLSYRKEVTFEQICAVIFNSNIEFEIKMKYKFLYTTFHIFDGIFKRAVLKSIPKEYEIDKVDDFEFMSSVNLPKFLSLNNENYSFILEGFEEGVEEKIVYSVEKSNRNKKKLFSIRDMNDKQFEIRWGTSNIIFNCFESNKIGSFLERKLKGVFKNYNYSNNGEIRLIYFWIEKHKKLENMALKFSDKYNIEYYNNQWIIKDNNDELDSVLFNSRNEKIKMINAIVGKNGSGKTTLLDAFKYYFNNRSDEKIFGRFFVIYEDGENLILRHNFKESENCFKPDCSKKFRIMKLDKNSGIFSDTRILSYTSFTEFSNYTGSEHNREIDGNHKDLSISNDYRILERIKNSSEREGIKRQLVTEDNYKKLTLLSESESLKNCLTEEIPLPHEILLNIKFYESYDSINIFMERIDRILERWFKGRIIEKKYNEKIKNEKLREEESQFDLKYRIKILNSKDFSFLYSFIENKSGEYKIICTLDFIGLSSGEYAKLTLFSRLFFESDHKKVKRIHKSLAMAQSYVRNYYENDINSEYMVNNQNDNLMILLDEGDMFFHPEWQKSFISDIKGLLNFAFVDDEIVKSIHILITSNSPFIMSDIPIEHTIVLGESYGMKQTYAQNIHDILKSSFFMYKGSLGEVAQRHIKELINKMKSTDVTEADRKYIEKSIDMIGEPMIRYKLESMYKKKFSGSIQIEERIRQLENELAKLKEGGLK